MSDRGGPEGGRAYNIGEILNWVRIRVSKGIQASRTTYREESHIGCTTDSSEWSRTAQDLAHVEDSSQSTSFRKRFDHDVMDCLRENIYQITDKLLFVMTYVVDNDPLWRVPLIIVVHGAYPYYRSIDRSHLTKK